ncbi:type I polyketide synthase [Crateriforma conspicua]|uniref:type I polyketide synthase n=1 Tax=Crateriforma TaxID=2714592 RepID=UPI0011B48D6F|nr:type I polyketide synthase [Crateriforma conspicua]
MIDFSPSTSNTLGPPAIAVVGLGCRFPGGANDPELFWQLLSQGRDAITSTPSDRWNLKKFFQSGESVPGKTQSRWGGFVDGIREFDPQLFGISPREAAAMDPQQRLLLQAAWQAMEDAGKPIESMAGSRTAVFVGISSIDYAVAGLSFRDRSVLGPYSNTGASSSIAANRVSYCFDLRGPSVAVDTACSSSLVALHLACQAMWDGQADSALVGGVNALLLPDFYIAFSQLGVLSSDGRCKTFDASANGYVRSEGAGMVMLKPLDDALRDGDQVYCVIRSTALNQDGHTDGMTVPSQQAQMDLMRHAYQKSGIDPGLVGYVEAHGTGTAVGDPIEAAAIAGVIGRHPVRKQPCYVGSVKTNIGHLEAGAGIASIIKVALSMRHRTIPRLLNFRSLNPAIDLADGQLRLPLENQNWPTIEGRRIAGINGFGYGGANAHVVIEDFDVGESHHIAKASGQQQVDASEFGQLGVPLPISGQSPVSLAENMDRWEQFLIQDGSSCQMDAVLAAAVHHRNHLRHRHVVFGCDTNRWATEFTRGPVDTTDAQRSISRTGRQAGILFACCGQGAQHWAMGRRLYAAGGAFAKKLQQCDQQIGRDSDWSLLEELHRDEADSRLNETKIAQPALFAIQVALASQWNTLGVRPSVLVGHSVGEIAAAYLCGGLSFDDACRVAFHRGRTMDLATSRGSMIAAGISADQAADRIAGQDDRLALAAVNGPESVTISGDDDAVESLACQLEREGQFVRRLAVEYAFHSPQMDPVRDELLESLASIQPKTPTLPMVSTVTGKLVQGPELDAEYWWQNVRQSVLFADAIDVAVDRDIEVALELGPHPVLSYMINECASQRKSKIHTVASLRRDEDEVDTMRRAFGQLYAVDAPIDWNAIVPSKTTWAKLPRYVMQKEDCWYESHESETTRLQENYHPLLGDLVDAPEPRWQNRLSLKTHSYLGDHRVRQSVLYPAAAMIESALSAMRQQGAEQVVRLKDVRLLRPMVLDAEHPQWTTVDFDSRESRLNFYSRGSTADPWQSVATVGVSDDDRPASSKQDFQSVWDRCDETVTQSRCYRYCNRLGLEYGAMFQGVRHGRRRSHEAVVEVCLPDDLLSQASDYVVHPALLDACFHAMVVADQDFDHHVGDLYLPSRMGRVQWNLPDATQSDVGLSELTVHARIASKDAYRMLCELTIWDSFGQLVAVIEDFESRNASGVTEPKGVSDLLYRYQWQTPDTERSDGISMNGRRRYLVMAAENGVAQHLIQRQRMMGIDIAEVRVGETFSRNQRCWTIDPCEPEHWDRLLDEVGAESISDVLHLWATGLPRNHEIQEVHAVRQTASVSTESLVLFAQAWDRRLKQADTATRPVSETIKPRLTVVTTGAQSTDDEPEDVQFCQTPTIGLGRVLISEFGSMSTRLVDLSIEDETLATEQLVKELTTDDEEDEVMYRGTRRFVRRYVPHASLPLPNSAKGPRRSRLALGKTVGIGDLHYVAQYPAELGDGDVEIEVLATGLNFSDVMKALDLYPGLPDGPVVLGAECCGRVTRVGRSVGEFQVGDMVVAIAKGSFATHAVVDQRLVARKPQATTPEQAACLPIAFLTAKYAIEHCARLRRGESLLVHSASGGVGLAAIQLAKQLGIHVHATAGNAQKRDHVRRLGVASVSDSRSLQFADDVRRATDGFGVDAVLNSLPGEAIRQGLGLLKTGGRFLEIGKRDIYGDQVLNLTPFRNNLAFFAIDLDQLFTEQPEMMGQMLRELMPQFDDGTLQPLPTKSFQANETREAFRWMQQAKHIGKVAISYEDAPGDVFPDQDVAPEPSAASANGRSLFKSDRTYWIAGGLGGFGMELARWMAGHGAGHLVLGGRSGKLSDEQVDQIDAIRAAGATVTHLPTDITDPVQVRRTMEQIRDELPPLAGIFHTAMVLKDRLLIDLDASTLNEVLNPKILGGWNLHKASLDRELVPQAIDHFVLFSSLSSIFGHAGQANYSAANAALDGLAMHRRCKGVPALVINWGHVGGAGYLAQRQELGDRLERQGVLRFSIDEAMRSLEELIRSDSIQCSVLKMDWSLWRGLGLTDNVSPRFAHLIRHESGAADVFDAGALRQVDMAERQSKIIDQLRSKLNGLLGLRSDQWDADRSLLELGLDSLMAVELRNWIESRFEIVMPISDLMSDANLSRITAAVDRQLMQTPVTESSDGADHQNLVADSATGDVDQVSPDDVDQMSEEELDQWLSRVGAEGVQQAILDEGSVDETHPGSTETL